MFKHFSTFIECSAGNTPTVDAIKKYIGMIAKMGYNELYLGCTDAYKMDGEPYFNYKRGGYTTEDFREMDRCAKENGIELIANIQTLGHLHFLQRHASYRDMMDNDNILMVGDERVYALVDKMFATISKGLSSRRIHIGYDECWGLGLGNYLKKNGPADKKELLLRHLKRVVEIAKKYGYTCEIWHDMLIERDNTKVTPEMVNAAIPEGTRVFYWSYFEGNEDVLRAGVEDVMHHADLLGYAGTAFKCGSMAPLNRYSLRRLVAQMKVSNEKKLDSFMVTMWSDNGAWVNNYTVLPVVYACAEYNSGRWNGIGEPDKERFKEICGIDYDAMMNVELLDDPLARKITETHANLSYVIMHMDIFNGGYDLMFDPSMPECYDKLADYYASVDSGAYAHVFNASEKFARVLAKKCRVGVGLREAYKKKDKQELAGYIGKLQAIVDALEEYAPYYYEEWLHDSMPFGLEVDQMFLGGEILRIKYQITRIQQYVENDVAISELDAETVMPDIFPDQNQFNYWNSDWRSLISNCGFM